MHVLFQKLPGTEIRWWYMRWWRGSKLSRNNRTGKELVHHLHYWLCCVHRCPTLLKQAVLFVTGKWNSESVPRNVQLLPFHRSTGPVIRHRDTTHHILTSKVYNCFPWKVADFQHLVFCYFGYEHVQIGGTMLQHSWKRLKYPYPSNEVCKPSALLMSLWRIRIL